MYKCEDEDFCLGELEELLDDYSTLAICMSILGLVWVLVFVIVYMLFI